MSVRNPATFTAWVDQMVMQTAKEIKTTEPAKVVDDQMYVLDHEEMVLAPLFAAVDVSGGAWVDIGVWHLESKDMCGDASVTNNEIPHDFMVYAVLSGAGTAEVRLVSTLATASGTATATVNSTTAQWFAGAAAMNVKTNANEDTLTLSARVTAGGVTVSVMGFALFANET